MTKGRFTLLGALLSFGYVGMGLGCSSTPDPGGAAGSPGMFTGGLINCTSDTAKQSAACTGDCTIPCGFNAVGVKTCTCIGNSYLTCPCKPPDDWGGAPKAPACPGDTVATAAVLKGKPCTTKYAECIGNDPVTGMTPQGCACLDTPGTPGVLSWACSSTNNWFTLQ